MTHANPVLAWRCYSCGFLEALDVKGEINEYIDERPVGWLHLNGWPRGDCSWNPEDERDFCSYACLRSWLEHPDLKDVNDE